MFQRIFIIKIYLIANFWDTRRGEDFALENRIILSLLWSVVVLRHDRFDVITASGALDMCKQRIVTGRMRACIAVVQCTLVPSRYTIFVLRRICDCYVSPG